MNDLELAKKLISFKSITSNCEECLKTLKFIQNYLKEYNPQIHEFNGHYSLFAKNCTDNNFDIVFNGHIDVVPCDEEQFSAYEKNGFLYARGAIDMKSQVAVMINLFKSTTNKKMAIILTSDEEIGGHNGTCKILEKYNIKSKVAIVPDGGNDFELINSERGVLQLDITAKGKSVHSSIMNKGINAVSLAYQ